MPRRRLLKGATALAFGAVGGGLPVAVGASAASLRSAAAAPAEAGAGQAAAVPGTARDDAATTRPALSPWSHLERMGDAEAGGIHVLAASDLGARRTVTAVRDSDGNLKIIIWELGYDGSVTRLGSAGAGGTTAIKVAAMDGRRFITAVRTGANRLKLILWETSADGLQIQRRGSAQTGTIRGEFDLVIFGNGMIVTGLRDSRDRFKLISWGVHPLLGLVFRRKDVSGEVVSQIALATYDAYPPDNGRLASVVITVPTRTRSPAAVRRLINWSVADDGGFTRLAQLDGGATSNIAVSDLSHRRIVTAARNAQNRLEVQSWDFADDGKISLHAGALAGEVDTLDIIARNAATAVTAVRTASGRLKLITWDAVDDIVRLGDASAGGVDRLSLVALGADWMATPVRTGSGALKVIAWREHVISMLQGQFGPDTPTATDAGRAKLEIVATEVITQPRGTRHIRPRFVDDVPTLETVTEGAADATASPQWSLRVEPGVAGVDPMIAVGHKYIVVTQDHRIAYFDKAMNRLAPNIKSTEFFASFLAGQGPDSSPNEHSLSRHMGFPPKGALDEFPPGAGVHCDPDLAWPANPICVGEFFDMRVYFDPASARFFVLAAARMQKSVSGTNVSTVENPLARRYWALAVSKTEDPRDGFYQWMSTEAHWFDFPHVCVNDGVFIMSADREADIRDIQPMGLKPNIYALAVDDLIAGKPYPRSHKIFPTEFAPVPLNRDIFPLTHHGETGGRTFLVRPESQDVHVFSFEQPTDWANFPELDHDMVTLSVPVGWLGHLGQYRDGLIYLTWEKQIVAPVPNGKNGRHSIALLRLPLTGLNTLPKISTSASDGYLYRVFGKSALEDDPGDLVSYEEPAMAVAKDGHMVILYGRAGFETANPLFPEARYSVYYADGRGLRRSRLLRAGEYLPMEVKSKQVDPTIETPRDRLDYQTAVVDPSDDRSVWMISEFADQADPGESKDAYRTVVGKVTP